MGTFAFWPFDRDGFYFDMINFLLLTGDIQRSTSYGVVLLLGGQVCFSRGSPAFAPPPSPSQYRLARVKMSEIILMGPKPQTKPKSWKSLPYRLSFVIRHRPSSTFFKYLHRVSLYHLGRAKRICYLSPMRAAKVQASLRIRAVSPEPSLFAHTNSESRGTFRQKARSLAPLNGWACAVEICHDGMLEDTNSLDGAHLIYKTSKGWRNV